MPRLFARPLLVRARRTPARPETAKNVRQRCSTPPGNFPSGNNHRLVHFFDQKPHSDHERIEDILADARASFRGAMAALDERPHDGVVGWRHDLTRQAMSERLLGGDFKLVAERALHVLSTQDPETETLEHGEARRLLRDALEKAQRVADLLAAEREIADHRNLSK